MQYGCRLVNSVPPSEWTECSAGLVWNLRLLGLIWTYKCNIVDINIRYGPLQWLDFRYHFWYFRCSGISILLLIYQIILLTFWIWPIIMILKMASFDKVDYFIDIKPVPILTDSQSGSAGFRILVMAYKQNIVLLCVESLIGWTWISVVYSSVPWQLSLSIPENSQCFSFRTVIKIALKTHYGKYYMIINKLL